MLEINYKLIHPDAKIPTKVHGGDSCFDLYAVQETKLSWLGMSKIVSTGLIIEIPEGWGGFIWDRSGLAAKQRITTRAGVIDSNYRDLVSVVMVNEGADDYTIKVGDRIAQIDFRPIYDVQFKLVDNVNETDRNGGFGSSGK